MRQELACNIADLSNKFEPIDRDRWPSNFDSKLFAAWISRRFMVQCYSEKDGVVRLSITRNEIGKTRTFVDGISWDELQDIKNQIGYADRMAIEIYPASDRVINVANMRHLWVLPVPLAVGWNQTADE
jgi:hypothetical protein